MSGKTINHKILFVILLILQVLYMSYWGNAKGGFYVDEFFTFDNAHYISDSTPKRVKLYDADFMEYDKWFDLNDLKGTLTVSKENALYNDSLIYNIKILFKSTYNWLLNYVEAVFFPGEVSKWSGILINLILFTLCQVFLYLISSKTSGSSCTALTACAIYGFSGLAISMVIYVRMYVLANLWMLTFLYMHMLMWDENDIRKNIVYEIISVLLLYLGYLRSPLVVLIGVSVILIFSIVLAVKKKWRQFAYYTIPILLGGIIYTALFTNYIKLFLNPSAAARGDFGSAKMSLIKGLLKLTPSSFIIRAINLIEIINDYLFGHIYVFILFGCLCVCSVFISFKQKWKRPFIYIVVLGAVCFYFIASVCFNLKVIRYNSFLYPLISIVIADILSDLLRKEKIGKVVVALLALALIGEIYYTASIPRIENLYSEEKAQIEAIRQNSGIDNIVVDYQFDDRVIYECLAYGDAETKVMFTHFEGIDFEDKGDTILVWQSVNWADDILPYLTEAGYIYVEQIAQTHESKVFLCSMRHGG